MTSVRKESVLPFFAHADRVSARITKMSRLNFAAFTTPPCELGAKPSSARARQRTRLILVGGQNGLRSKLDRFKIGRKARSRAGCVRIGAHTGSVGSSS